MNGVLTVPAIIVALIYLIVVMFLGFYGYRKTKDATDYLVAGRAVHPYVMALSYGATFISTSAIVGFGGAAAFFGMGLLWLTFLNIFVGIFIAFVFFGKRVRRLGHNLNAHTFPEMLGRRFQSKFIQLFAGLIIFLFIPLYAAAVLIGAAQFISVRFGISQEMATLIFAFIIALYVIAGGLKGVMYTDALQGSLMLIGMVALLFFAYAGLGGVTKAHQELSHLPDTIRKDAQASIEQYNQANNETLTPELIAQGAGLATPLAAMSEDEAAQWTADNPEDAALVKRFKAFMGTKPKGITSLLTLMGTKGPGFEGWTQMPRSGSVFWYFLVTTIIMGVGIGVLAQPQLAVRFMTVKSGRELNRAVLVGGIFILMMTGVAFVVGALSNVFLYNAPEVGQISFMAAEKNTDRIIPIYIEHAMPTWFVLLFMLTLLSAAMSTLSSQFHAMGTSIGRDVYEQVLAGGERRGTTVLITRLGILIAIIATVILSLKAPGSIIAPATALFFGLCASSFLPMLVGALYSRGITKAGAIWGMVAGFGVSIFWLLCVQMVKAKAPALLAAWLLKQDSFIMAMPWRFVDALFIGLPVSIIVTIVVSLFTQKMPEEHMDMCFHGVGKS
jgi:SSS family solute:Na+ symporter